MIARMAAVILAGLCILLCGLLLASYSEVAQLAHDKEELGTRLAEAEKHRQEMAMEHNAQLGAALRKEMGLRREQLEYAYEDDPGIFDLVLPDSLLAPLGAHTGKADGANDHTRPLLPAHSGGPGQGDP